MVRKSEPQQKLAKIFVKKTDKLTENFRVQSIRPLIPIQMRLPVCAPFRRKAFLILLRLAIILQPVAPAIIVLKRAIHVGIVRKALMTAILQPQKGEAGIVLVCFVVFVIAVFNRRRRISRRGSSRGLPRCRIAAGRAAGGRASEGESPSQLAGSPELQ